jgi:hypothetical protein
VSADVDAVLAIAARRSEQFPHGDDWVGLAAVGPNGDLVGSDVAELEVGPASELRIRLDQADQFDAVPTADGRAPFVLTGVVTGPRPSPPGLVVAINGRLAGILGGARPSGGDVAVSGYVADLYRRGANEVIVYEVGREGTEVTLHEVGQT